MAGYMLGILDDKSRLKDVDQSGMLSILQRTPQELQEAIGMFRASSSVTANRKVTEVVVVGVGGSSIGGDVIANWLSEKAVVPIITSRGTQLPNFADEDTLVITTSYSGDTKETLGQFYEARRRRCIVSSVTSGGMLAEISEKQGISVKRLKSGVPPRTAFPQMLVATMSILQEYGIIQDLEDVQPVSEHLEKLRAELSVAKGTPHNFAKQMALKLIDTLPIIYSLERMSSVARRFKNQLNENSKIPAKFDTIPEICHNEVESWPQLTSDSWKSKCSFVFIRDDNEYQTENRIVERTMDHLRELEIKEFSQIRGTGPNRLAKLLSAIYVADFVSFYLAIARGVDPTPITEITRLKKSIWKSQRLSFGHPER